MWTAPSVGDRIIVHGIMYATAKVANVVWDTETHRYVLTVDWGEHGYSRVFDHDEGNVWYRYKSAN